MLFRALPLRRLCVALSLAGCAAAASAASFVFGTSQPEDTVPGRLQRLIYGEAFRRLGLPVEFSLMPLQRLSISADEGVIDGDVARVRDYGSLHPELVRVDEPVYEVTWSLFVVDPSLELRGGLSALPASGWRATYLRGVGICENALKPLLPAQRLTDVTSDAQGFQMLRLGRAEAHCTADLSALTLQRKPEFAGTRITRHVAEIGTFALFPYLNQRHAALAERLAVTLRQMKAERLVERYRAQVLSEPEPR
jgi:hypothetical protein